MAHHNRVINDGQQTAPSNTPPPIFQTSTNPAQNIVPRTSLKDRLKNPVNQAIAGAVWYGLDGVAEMYEMNTLMGTPELAFTDATFVFLIVAIPTALMFFRRGYVSAALLGLIALMNAQASYTALQAGNPYFDWTSVITNLLMLALFARASWSLWKTRKSAAA